MARTADISARSLTVTATGIDKVYDGTTNAQVTLSDDRLSGGHGDDSLDGGAGNDRLNADGGKDTVTGGLAAAAQQLVARLGVATSADAIPRGSSRYWSTGRRSVT